MNDPYRIGSGDTAPADPSGTPVRRPSAKQGGAVLRAGLWILLMISAVVNVIANNLGDGVSPLGLGAGGVAAACIVGLIVHHYNRRKA
ncbi:hypothetical protein [Rhizohabitans arisaemae]|uniref:hypothetical protein n=1 Tax=Rhizohabitans arisaemae TaxID=2720610 RepID=UPI0024B192F4|nr:hypothetical protein [Rhizohabitans arisaemae]